MIFLYLVIFIDAMAYGTLVPLLPLLTAAHGAGPALSGLVMALFSLCQLSAAPLVGWLSDRHGRRPILLACLGAAAAGYALAGLGNSLVFDLIGVMLVGAGGASMATAQAALADRSGRPDRLKHIGRAGAAAGLGMIAGALTAGVFSSLDLIVPVLIAGGLALANALAGFLFLKETPDGPSTALRDEHGSGNRPAPGVRPPAGRLKPARSFGLPVLFAVDCALAALALAFPIHAARTLAWGPSMISLAFAAAGLCSAGTQLALGARLAKALGTRGTAAAGMGAMLAGLVAALALGAWIPALILFAAGSGLALAACTALVSLAVEPSSHGAMLGAAQAVLALALMTGPLAGGLLYGWAGPQGVLVFCLASVGLALLALPMISAE